MLDLTSSHEAEVHSPSLWNYELPAAGGVAALLRGLEPRRRLMRPKAHVFRAGQAASSVFLINSGVFKTSITSDDGREKITGFRMRGELLGLDSLGLDCYACDAVDLATGEVWEYSRQQLLASSLDCPQRLGALLAGEIRRDWDWMLATSTLSAEQRVVSFLLDLSTRMQGLGFNAHALSLPMSRSELGNYLALQLETVVRALSKLQALGLVGIEGREIALRDIAGLRALLARPAHAPALRAA